MKYRKPFDTFLKSPILSPEWLQQWNVSKLCFLVEGFRGDWKATFTEKESVIKLFTVITSFGQNEKKVICKTSGCALAAYC